MVPLVLIEQAFFIANIIKVCDGGWFPLAIGSVIGLLMLTWHRGTKRVDPAPPARTKPNSIGWCASSKPNRRTRYPAPLSS